MMVSISEDMKKTLLSIKEGKLFTLRGDKSIGLELNRDCSKKASSERNCRSLAPLMRMGLIEFADVASDSSRFYRVRITEKGVNELYLGMSMLKQAI